MTGNTAGICLQGNLCVAPMAPFITGDITAPSTLTGQLISNVMYQWIRDLDDIPGATSETYVLTSADVGHLIRVRMHFTDADNNFITVTSKPVGPIEGPSGAFVSAGAFSANNGSSNSLTVQMPANIVSGNLLFVWMAGNNAFTANPVTGWTFLNTVVANDYVVAYRIADGSEGTSVNFGWSGTLGLYGQALQFSGVNTMTPLGAHNTNVATSTVASNAGITTSSTSSIVLALILVNSNNQAISVPSGWNEMSGAADNSNSPYGHGVRAANILVTPAGPSGSLSVPIVPSATWRVSLYEIILA